MKVRNILSSVAFLVVSCVALAAHADPQDGAGADAPGDEPGSSSSSSAEDEGIATPEVVGWEDSSTNTDYAPKDDATGSTWTFDPSKVQLNTGTSETGTNFQGARILKGDEDVIVQGETLPGAYEDESNVRYSYWQGSTFFFGTSNPETNNSVDGIVEFFWFESSIPRGSDFYVAHVKVKSSPSPWDKWFLSKEPNFFQDYILFWNDIQPSQHLDVHVEAGGNHGSLRWDFCVPFETYKWEPVKTMQIQESYGAGYSVTGNANVKGKASQQFKEGGLVADVTGDANIQAKGYVNNDFKVQSQYTITLYRWQMLVNSGGQHISYKMVLLPHDEENDSDSGYYEYYIVIQAHRGTPVHIEEIEIGGNFRHEVPLWVDNYEGLSVSVGDIWITPPRGVCLPGDIPPAGTCASKGVCGMVEPECVDNKWVCPVLAAYEPIESLCDGLDNDCDGLVDEQIERECSTACGGGYETCVDGKYQGCDAIQPVTEVCGDGVDNDCDGTLDNGCADGDPTQPTNSDPQNEVDPTPISEDPEPFGKDSGSNGATDSPKPVTDYNPNQTPQTPVPPTAGGCTTVAAGSSPAPAALCLLLLGFLVARRRLS